MYFFIIKYFCALWENATRRIFIIHPKANTLRVLFIKPVAKIVLKYSHVSSSTNTHFEVESTVQLRAPCHVTSHTIMRILFQRTIEAEEHKTWWRDFNFDLPLLSFFFTAAAFWKHDYRDLVRHKICSYKLTTCSKLYIVRFVCLLRAKSLTLRVIIFKISRDVRTSALASGMSFPLLFRMRCYNYLWIGRKHALANLQQILKGIFTSSHLK